MAFTYTTLPKYIQDIFFSQTFFDFIVSLRDRFELSDEQKDLLDTLIDDIFAKNVSAEDVMKTIQERFGFDENNAKNLAKQLILNIVLCFPDYFGDHTATYRSLGGDPVADFSTSPTVKAFAEQVGKVLEEQAEPLKQIDFEKEAPLMRELFEKNLIAHFYAPDGEYKVRLNDTILGLLMTQDKYNETLLDALYKNEEKIGEQQIVLGDGSIQQTTVASWIKDYLGFSGGTISSISLAKYLTQGKNVSSLEVEDKEALRRLLETFIVLKNFPESFDKIPEEQWMVIPYHLEEEGKAVIHDSRFTIHEEGKIVGIATPPLEVRNDISVSVQATGFPIESGMTKTPVPPPQPTTYNLQAAPIDYDAVATQVLKKVALALTTDISDRVKKIVVTRIRNIRNGVDTKERFVASVADGGAGLSSDDADKVLKEANVAALAIATGKVEEYVPKMQNQEVGQLDPRLLGDDKEVGIATPPLEVRNDNQLPPQMIIKEVDGVPTLVEKKPINGKKKEIGIATPLPEVRNDKTDVSPLQPAFAPVVPPLNPKPSTLDPIVIPVIVRGAQASGGVAKTVVADVKAPVRLVGMNDELRALTMKDFRRISQDPKVAAQRLYEKVENLGKQSLTKKAEAIKAWKESDVYQLYLEIGQQNIGADMTKLVEERKTAGKEYLTSEEFDALLDLNERLRF